MGSSTSCKHAASRAQDDNGLQIAHQHCATRRSQGYTREVRPRQNLVQRCQQLGRRHLQLYQALALLAARVAHLRWRIRPKMHYIHHTKRELSTKLNPRFLLCFLDEDFMGTVKGVAESCSVATPLHGVPRKIVEKWRLGWRLPLIHQQDDA